MQDRNVRRCSARGIVALSMELQVEQRFPDMTDFAARRTTMVDTQVRPSDVTKFPIIEAMLAIPREEFVPASRRAIAYSGETIDLGHGRHMLDPRTLAKMIDGLDLEPTDLVLDLACGMGYGAAVLARMCEAVVAVEEIPELVAEAERRLAENGIFNVAVLQGELREGCPSKGHMTRS